jgi:MOSC domain-containing protein YiiM
MSATKEVMALIIDGVLAGKAVEFSRPGSRSAIAKSRLEGSQRVTLLGILGDEQGDLRVHGGPDKAIHHYPADHYARWRRSAAQIAWRSLQRKSLLLQVRRVKSQRAALR